MHYMKLSNKQIQEILVDIRQQLKGFKSRQNTLSINWKMPACQQEKARLVILPVAWEKLTALVKECDKEIAWHGTVIRSENTYTIKDIFVFPQTVTGATVTSDETEYSMWLANQPDEVFNNLRFHGHSHVNMGVSPSGVDTNYQEDILRNLKDFYIFAIFNKKGDHWCAIYDIENNIAYDNTDIELITPETGYKEWAAEAMKQYVKTSTVHSKPVATSKKGKEKKSLAEELAEDIKDNPYDPRSSEYYNYGYGYPWRGYYE